MCYTWASALRSVMLPPHEACQTMRFVLRSVMFQWNMPDRKTHLHIHATYIGFGSAPVSQIFRFTVLHLFAACVIIIRRYTSASEVRLGPVLLQPGLS